MDQKVPPQPWLKITRNLFTINITDYLLIVEYMSRFFVIQKLASQTSKVVIKQFKSVFAEYDVPDTFISDNRPCDSSQDFKIFAKKYIYNHVTSFPHYKENGLTDKHIDIVNNRLQKTLKANEDPYRSMLIYSMIPFNSNMPSPTELLNKRIYTDLHISNLRWSFMKGQGSYQLPQSAKG